MIDYVADAKREKHGAHRTVTVIVVGTGSNTYAFSSAAGHWVHLSVFGNMTLVRGSVTVADKVGVYLGTSQSDVWVPAGTTHISTHSAAGGALAYSVLD